MLVAKAADSKVRDRVVVLGDSLDRGAAAFEGFDAARDLVRMTNASRLAAAARIGV